PAVGIDVLVDDEGVDDRGNDRGEVDVRSVPGHLGGHDAEVVDDVVADDDRSGVLEGREDLTQLRHALPRFGPVRLSVFGGDPVHGARGLGNLDAGIDQPGAHLGGGVDEGRGDDAGRLRFDAGGLEVE